MSQQRFTIRWDVRMGCYRVSVPEFEGPLEVVPASDYDEVSSTADVFKVAIIDALRLTHSEDVLRERLWNAVEDYQEAVLALEGESCQGKEKTR